MLEYLPKELRDGFAVAQRRSMRRTRLCVHVGGAVYPILRWWDGGFALDGRLAPQLRGLVDIYDGPRHLCQCLIVASLEEGDEVICELKRTTLASDRPPIDFIRETEAPSGLLPRF
ncbi:hypothetical protein ACFQXB_02670 [Plastorhodobacter daqingensis]|uniref:Uncharacterized protein n=1 Tax=Plastorhodobacter daqingensis TaxID=1387281 RepID=A0ABW2UEK0_9RHOB